MTKIGQNSPFLFNVYNMQAIIKFCSVIQHLLIGDVSITSTTSKSLGQFLTLGAYARGTPLLLALAILVA